MTRVTSFGASLSVVGCDGALGLATPGHNHRRLWSPASLTTSRSRPLEMVPPVVTCVQQIPFHDSY